MIAIRWVEEAGERVPERDGEIVVGADIARGGSDSTVFVARRGMNAFASEEHHQSDTMQSTALLVMFCTKYHADRLQVDAVGLGAGVVDRLRELLPTWRSMRWAPGRPPMTRSTSPTPARVVCGLG